MSYLQRMKGLGLDITYKCTSSCLHCAVRASPLREGIMRAEDAQVYINEVAHLQLEWLCISGGEPFLYFDTLLEVVKLANRAGIPTVWVLTNGYWAANREVAAKKLSKLKDAGLTHICFSVDAFHQQFIDKSYVKTGMEVAEKLGFKVYTFSAFIHEDAANPFNLKTKEILKSLDIHRCKMYGESKLMWMGRSTDTIAEDVPVDTNVFDRQCESIWVGGTLVEPESITIDPHGNVLLCPGLAIGNTKQTQLSKIIDKYNPFSHPIINRIINSKGLEKLREVATSKGWTPKPGYVDICHLCYDLRRLLHPYYPEWLTPKEAYNE